jgi:hypothetical protein
VELLDDVVAGIATRHCMPKQPLDGSRWLGAKFMKGYMSVEELISNPMVTELIETIWDDAAI